MTRIDTDVLVAGGGPAGLAAAALFAAEGLETLCLDPAPPPADDAPGADLRTAALLRPSVEALEAAGAWDRLDPDAAPLWTMRLVDAGGPERPPVIRETADFVASEIQDRPFGWNLPNLTIRRALIAHLEAAEGAELRRAALARLTLREGHALAALSDGATVRARLVVAADGRDSPTRGMAGLSARRWSYAQKALVFAVRHDRPHEGVSTEIHRTGGPFTLVPLPDDAAGRPRSAIVWMEPGPRAVALQAAAEHDLPAFEAELNARSCGVLGRLSLASRTALWPIVSQLAPRLDGVRTALMGEAAHVVPPIGAQGLNMSIADAAALARLAGDAARAGGDPGAPALLARYHRARWPEMAARVGGVDVLNRAAMAEAQPIRDLRRLGLRTLHGLVPLRRTAMRLGMGAG